MLFYVIGYTVLSLKVLVGLGFVIFVHELGHFTVAKLCGVKCEKFYLGFDIGGLRFCKFRWGETEYGIGILPLGGYVKMLGQEDNPAKIKAEMERAKEKAEAVPRFDPRSFLAKSVPKRMAIISAGVIMNVIFAFVMAVVAVSPWMGVPTPPCVVGGVLAGDPAWQVDLRPGDEILKIADKKMTQFRDLQSTIPLGEFDPKVGVPLSVRRPGVERTLKITVKPDRSLGAFFIGVTSGNTTRLRPDLRTWLIEKEHAVLPGSAADLAVPAFRNGDNVVRINDVPIGNYGRIEAELAQTADKRITVTVVRAVEDAQGKPTGKTEQIPIPVAPNPMRELGLVMKMGEITAIQDGSPAKAAGIKPGDRITQIDGGPAGDPMTLF